MDRWKITKRVRMPDGGGSGWMLQHPAHRDMVICVRWTGAEGIAASAVEAQVNRDVKVKREEEQLVL